MIPLGFPRETILTDGLTAEDFSSEGPESSYFASVPALDLPQEFVLSPPSVAGTFPG